jgi:hypothetical protein
LFNKEIAACDAEWPFLITFTSNFFYNTNSFGCLHYFWYISNDIQYFIIGVILLKLYSTNKFSFKIVFILINILSLAAEIFGVLYYEQGNNIIDFKKNNFNHYNTSIYAWSFPYFLGFLIGLAFSQYKEKNDSNKWLADVKDSTLVSITYYFAGLCLMFFFTVITYWSYNESWGTIFTLIHNVFLKKFISIGFFLMTIPLLFGKLFSFNAWLGLKIFTYMSKLSYSAFLISPLVIRYVVLNMKIGFVLQKLYVLVMIVAIIVTSFAASVLLFLFVEMPFNRMRQYFKKRSQSDKISFTDVRDE